MELALLSAAKLGMEPQAALSDLYRRAKEAGLELCPAEVGPQLRLDYRNQPVGEALNIAMEPVATTPYVVSSASLPDGCDNPRLPQRAT